MDPFAGGVGILRIHNSNQARVNLIVPRVNAGPFYGPERKYITVDGSIDKETGIQQYSDAVGSLSVFKEGCKTDLTMRRLGSTFVNMDVGLGDSNKVSLSLHKRRVIHYLYTSWEASDWFNAVPQGMRKIKSM